MELNRLSDGVVEGANAGTVRLIGRTVRMTYPRIESLSICDMLNEIGNYHASGTGEKWN